MVTHEHRGLLAGAPPRVVWLTPIPNRCGLDDRFASSPPVRALVGQGLAAQEAGPGLAKDLRNDHLACGALDWIAVAEGSPCGEAALLPEAVSDARSVYFSVVLSRVVVVLSRVVFLVTVAALSGLCARVGFTALDAAPANTGLQAWVAWLVGDWTLAAGVAVAWTGILLASGLRCRAWTRARLLPLARTARPETSVTATSTLEVTNEALAAARSFCGRTGAGWARIPHYVATLPLALSRPLSVSPGTQSGLTPLPDLLRSFRLLLLANGPGALASVLARARAGRVGFNGAGAAWA
jgi:hypothetical protein